MIIDEITQQYEFPKEIIATSLTVVLDPNAADGFINIKASFGKKVDDTFIPFLLSNGLTNFDVFSGRYSDLLRQCLESKKLTDQEITTLISEVEQLRQKIDFVCELALTLGYKAEILKFPALPTNKK